MHACERGQPTQFFVRSYSTPQISISELWRAGDGAARARWAGACADALSSLMRHPLRNDITSVHRPPGHRDMLRHKEVAADCRAYLARAALPREVERPELGPEARDDRRVQLHVEWVGEHVLQLGRRVVGQLRKYRYTSRIDLDSRRGEVQLGCECRGGAAAYLRLCGRQPDEGVGRPAVLHGLVDARAGQAKLGGEEARGECPVEQR